MFTKKPTELTGKSVFATIKDFLCFAAVLGYAKNKRVPFDHGEPKDDIQEFIFSKDKEAMRVIYLIALAASKSITIFKEENSDEMVRCFEEFANGGLSIIKSWHDEMPQDLIGLETIVTNLAKNNFIGSEVTPMQGTITF